MNLKYEMESTAGVGNEMGQWECAQRQLQLYKIDISRNSEGRSAMLKLTCGVNPHKMRELSAALYVSFVYAIDEKNMELADS